MPYQRNDAAIPDDLCPAEPCHLVQDQTLFLNDPRNTPVRVTKLDPNTASFSVEVIDFEDIGADWTFALWDCAKFQVRAAAHTLSQEEVDKLMVQVPRLQKRTNIPATAKALQQTHARLEALRRAASAWCNSYAPDLPDDAEALMTKSASSPVWSAARQGFFQAHDVLAIDDEFACAYTSNPNASEFLTAHRMTLAHLGLCPYDGPVLRDPVQLAGPLSREHRSRHILTRLAFVQMMLKAHRLAHLPLYRSIYASKHLTAPQNRGFVSTTLHFSVAQEVFASATEGVAALYRQFVPAERVFMSFHETPKLCAKYDEAELVLIHDPANTLF